jgi:hypothetical protein
MADVAVGRNCPGCGTLTAVPGSFHDKELTTTCAVCGTSICIANPHYVKPAIYPPLMAHLQTLSEDEQRMLHESLADSPAPTTTRVLREPTANDELFDEHDAYLGAVPQALSPEKPHAPTEREAADLGRPEGD